MGSRVKEEEKNERIIRGLLKLPANRRCINCNSLGPQYVCTNFWTFICTNCSGIHREFTHRVKSISMAKFTSQEVSALQEGGNERAKEIYFKEWDPQHRSIPDNSDVDRLRDFIKHVYVERRFTGERNVDKPPRAKGDGIDSSQEGSRSPPYTETYERRYADRPGRSPGRSPPHVEGQRFPDVIPKPGVSSPKHPDAGESVSSTGQPVREILGGIPPVRILEPPRLNRPVVPTSSALTQGTGSSSSSDLAGSSVDVKAVTSRSLIDFDAEPEQPHSGGQQTVEHNSAVPAADSGWASFDTAAASQKAPPATSSVNTVESLLAQMTNPASEPVANFSTGSIAHFGSSLVTDNRGQQQQLAQFPVAGGQFTNPPPNQPVAQSTSYQPWAAPLASSLQGTAPIGQISQVLARGPNEPGAGVSSQPPFTGAVSSGRRALPEDLFTMAYPRAPTPVPGWHPSPYIGMGYSMQYPPAATMPAFAHSPQPVNPFDVANEPRLAHASTFPSLTPLQGSLPNMSNPSLLSRASSFDSLASQWIPPQQPSYPAVANPRPYMIQQHASNVPPQVHNNAYPMGQQAVGGFGNMEGAFGASSANQNSPRNAQQQNLNPFPPPAGRNPFA